MPAQSLTIFLNGTALWPICINHGTFCPSHSRVSYLTCLLGSAKSADGQDIRLALPAGRPYCSSCWPHSLHNSFHIQSQSFWHIHTNAPTNSGTVVFDSQHLHKCEHRRYYFLCAHNFTISDVSLLKLHLSTDKLLGPNKQ